MQKLISEIKIGERFRKDTGNIASLANSIKEVGLLHPVVIDSENNLIAGLRRIKAVKMLGWTQIEVNQIPLKDLVKGEVEENTERKDFAPNEWIDIKRAVEPEIKAEAEQHSKQGKPLSNLDTGVGRVDSTIANFVGVGKDTLRKAEAVIVASEKEPEKYLDLAIQMNTEKRSVDSVYKELQKRTKPKIIKPIPEGKYNVIYADPPWKYNNDFLQCSPNQHYAIMEIDEICNLNIPSNDDAVLFLWVTNPFLEEAFKVIKAWGFNYKSNLVWIKDKMGIGYYVRGQHELLLICVKGKIHPPEDTDRPSSIIQSPVREHSQKPEEVYSLIEKMYPNSKYLEVFARNKRANWVSWGNELE